MMNPGGRHSMNEANWTFAGLKLSAYGAFPKVCANCQRSYASTASFFADTRPPQTHPTGLMHTEGDAGESLVQAFRVCRCGSSLMQYFRTRRDTSAEGVDRREAFAMFVNQLARVGVSTEQARDRLLGCMHQSGTDIQAFCRRAEQLVREMIACGRSGTGFGGK